MNRTQRIAQFSLATILVIILAAYLALSAGATGATTDPVIMGNPKTGDVLIVSAYEASSAAEARSLVGIADDAFVESAMDGVVVTDFDSVIPVKGSTATKMFAVTNKEGDSGVLVMASVGNKVYLFLEIGMTIPTEDMIGYIEACTSTDTIAKPPAGFRITKNLN